MTKIIILDRDGVINFDSPAYIKSPSEWHAIPGSLEAIATLNRAGFRVIVATNQSGIGRGYYDLSTLESIHEKLMQELAAVGGQIEEIFFCPHRPEDFCNCRKPQPGMLQQIQKKYAVDMGNVFFVGDSYSDVQVAKEAGCKPIIVLTGNGQETIAKYPELQDVLQFDDLAKAADFVINVSAQQEK